MAIDSTLVIYASVGRGGCNRRDDVRAVQTRLNALMSPPRQFLEVDGLNGPKTTGAIRDFQKAVIGMSWPDGRVDVGQRTHRHLDDPLSKEIWQGQRMTSLRSECPSAGAPACAAAPAAASPSRPASQPETRARTHLDHAADELRWSSAEYDAFARDVLDNPDRNVGMAVLSVITTANDAKDFLQGWKALRSGGCSNRDLVRAVMDRRHGNGNFNVIQKLGQKQVVMRHLSVAASAADRVLLLMVAMEVHDHLVQGRWGAAASVVYQTGMGVAIPWAGFVNAVQGIITALFPGAAESRFFQALRALDPVGLGGVAVDSFVTGAIVLIEALHKGHLNMAELMALRSRMAQTPAAFIAELGDELGDSVYQLRHTVNLGRDTGTLMRQIGRDLGRARDGLRGLLPI